MVGKDIAAATAPTAGAASERLQTHVSSGTGVSGRTRICSGGGNDDINDGNDQQLQLTQPLAQPPTTPDESDEPTVWVKDETFEPIEFYIDGSEYQCAKSTNFCPAWLVRPVDTTSVTTATTAATPTKVSNKKKIADGAP